MPEHRAAYTGNAAAREGHQMGGKERSKKSQILSCKLVSLFVFSGAAFFLIFSVTVKRENQANTWNNKRYEVGSANGDITEQKRFEGWRGNVNACNYSDGRWIQDAKIKARYGHKCKEIFKGWKCIANNKSNARDILQWRWQPWGCDLPRFDPILFLEQFRDTSIGFVGDSLNRNMFVSLVCMLKEASDDVRKWRPARADRGFTFLQYNVTLAYHRTNLLARYSRWSANSEGGALEQLGYKEGYRVDVDIPDGSWAEAPSYHDILILNTGHWWWAPAKFDPVKLPMLFFEKGQPISPPKSPEEGLDMALQNMVDFVQKSMPKNALKLFRTQSPRHFEGGDWNEGGTCRRVKPLLPEEVEHMFSVEKHSPNIEVRLANGHLQKVLKASNFHLLDITYMSEFRADAHPSTSGGKKHEDCMHWCLPGITDYWNDLLIVTLINEKMRVS